MKSTLPTQREIRIQGGLYREDSVCFLMSSKLACPEWNNSTVFYRVGDSEMMRIRGTSWSILPSFKIMYYYLQRLHILIWLSLLSFSKTEAKSGKLCFLFKSTVKVSTHMCLQCSISVTLKIREWALSMGTCDNRVSLALRRMSVVAVKEVYLSSPCHACQIISFRRNTFLLTMLCHPCVRWC